MVLGIHDAALDARSRYAGWSRSVQYDLHEAFSGATGFGTLGATAVDAARRLVGAPSNLMFPLGASTLTDFAPVGSNERYGLTKAVQRTVEAFPVTEAEIGSADSVVAAGGRIVYLNELIGAARLRRTATYNELWRDLGVEEQLVGVMRDAFGQPMGFLAFGRTHREGVFTDLEQRRAEVLVEEAEMAFRSLQRNGAIPILPPGDLAMALQSALPLACALLDSEGRVAWMSDAAMSGLQVKVMRFGNTRVALGGDCRLDAWRELARSIGRGDSPAPGVVACAAAKARIASPPGARPLVLVWMDKPSDVDGAPGLTGLTPRERQVAKIVAGGHSVLSAAALLSLSEHTLRTHLKHIYRKLGVVSRVELALRMRGW